MAISDGQLVAQWITTREVGDAIQDESYVTQDGTLHKALIYGHRKLEFRVFMTKLTGDLASEEEWRIFLAKATITYDSKTWTCIETPPFRIEYLDDNADLKILRFVLTETTGYTT
jgi:hypothetical protein